MIIALILQAYKAVALTVTAMTLHRIVLQVQEPIWGVKLNLPLWLEMSEWWNGLQLPEVKHGRHH